MISYFKRDGQLFEVIAEDLRRNYGCGPSVIREIALRDVVTGDIRFAVGARIATYLPVSTEGTGT